MEFIEIYSHTKNRIIGYEKRDDLGRLMYSEDYSEESECNAMNIVYKDTEDGKSYKSVIAKTKSLIVDKYKNKQIAINTNTVENDYICGYEIPKRITTEECDEFGKLIKSSNIEFDINVDAIEFNATKIICKPSNSNVKGYISFLINNSNNFIDEYINSYENIYYAFDRYKYFDKSDPTNEHEVIRFEEYDGIFLQKYTIINKYDNGLYERNFEFDRNDNLLGGRIKFYYPNKTLSYECILDKYKSVVETIIYHYRNDGKLSYTTNSKGEKLIEYIYRNISFNNTSIHASTNF